MKFKKLFSRPVKFFFCSIFALSLGSLSALAAAAEEYPSYPTINYGTGSKAEQLKRGEYLTKLGDCIACHTAPGKKQFAGGFSIDTPFGTIYTPNITADKETGIGNWSDKDFIR